MAFVREFVLESNTPLPRGPQAQDSRCTRSHSHPSPFTQTNSRPSSSRKRLRCEASDEWMSDIAQNVVLYPEKLIQSGAAYLCGGCALIATAALGVRLILWDYQERKSDDPERFADLQSPIEGIELQRSSHSFLGVAWNLMRFYDDPFDNTELLLTEDECRDYIDQPFTVDSWSAPTQMMRLFMKSTLREWNAVAFGLVTCLLSQQASLSPRITWFLLDRSQQTANAPPKRDWRPPLASALATNDALEGAALHSLQMFMRSRTMCFLLQRLHTLFQTSSLYLNEA